MSQGARDAAPTPSTAVYVLVAFVAAAAVGSLVASAGPAWDEVSGRPLTFTGFLAVTAALQLLAVRIRDRGAISVSGIMLLATGFMFGPGAAIVCAVAAAAVHAARSRPSLHRAVFNAASFSLAAAAASGCYQLLETSSRSTVEEYGIALVSGALFAILNIGLLSLAMGLSEGRGVVEVWSERLRWLTPYYVSFGVLALAATLAYEDLGLLALVVFAAPPALIVLRASLPRRLGSAT